MLKSKIHRATVTGCDPDYVGSITLDPELMRSADVIPDEQVHVWDIQNGARFVTYAIEGEPDDRAVQVNGAAPRLVTEGDKVIVPHSAPTTSATSGPTRPSSCTWTTATRSSAWTRTLRCCSAHRWRQGRTSRYRAA